MITDILVPYAYAAIVSDTSNRPQNGIGIGNYLGLYIRLNYTSLGYQPSLCLK